MIFKVGHFLWVLAFGMFVCGTIWSEFGEPTAKCAAFGACCVSLFVMLLGTFVDKGDV